MALTDEEKAINKIKNKTIKDLKALGIYRDEFSATIAMYAQSRYLYDILYHRFEENGYQVMEEYTNKAGATNLRKTAEYQALETLRKDIRDHECILGLTPSGLKKIRADTRPKKESKLGAILDEYS